MAKKIVKKDYTIDAAGQILGRLATQVAVFLRGKIRLAFCRED
jgi:ribosomal protein L13